MQCLRYSLLILVVVPLLAACAGANGRTTATTMVGTLDSAQGRLNVMVLGNDADPASLDHSHRIFRRVLTALEDELHFAGYDTWSEDAVTAQRFSDAAARRGESDLLEIARLANRPPMDIAVLFSIYPDAFSTAATTVVSVRLTGKLISLPDGRNLGAFEVDSPNTWTAPPNCTGECLLEEVGDRARLLAQSLGDVLVAMLDDQTGAAAFHPAQTNALAKIYYLAFEGFDAADTRLIEEYLVAFTGYQNHTLNYASPRHTEYGYMTTDEAGELLRKFDAMLDRMGVAGQVIAAGNEFKVVHIPSQDARRVNAEGL